jgi:hypothetical protein
VRKKGIKREINDVLALSDSLLWKESFNSDDQQFHKINKTNIHLSHELVEHKTDHDI